MQIEMTNMRWGLVAALVLSLGLLIYLSWPKTPDTVKMLAEVRKEMTAAHKKEMDAQKQKVADIESKDKTKDVEIQASKGRYARLMELYKKAKEAQANVKPAQTNQELRDRFTAAGVTPAPADQHGPGLICFPTAQYSR
jgi:hypothetical protein